MVETLKRGNEKFLQRNGGKDKQKIGRNQKIPKRKPRKSNQTDEKKTIQDLKTEIEVIKKTQTEGIIETEIKRKPLGTTNASINSRIQEMEERLSSVEDTIEETDSLVKENIKSNKSLIQNIGNMGHHEKTKHKNNRDRRRSSTQKHRKYI